jgi:outer membrane protein OmpA-like peptidoglycan-associated protein
LGGTSPYVPKDTKYHGSTWGNTDIYVSEKTDKGWSEPINLGTTINTPFAERKPFLHPDGKTLYFSSEGHTSIGRLDVYMATRLNETSWTDWSEPKNLGKNINTGYDDWGYKISTDGTTAYYAAQNNESGNQNLDIYSVPLPQQAKPEEVFIISGKVTDEKETPLEADLTWEDVTSGKLIGKLKSNPITGEYFIAVPFGKKIGYFASKEGYYETSNFIDLSTKNKTEKIRQDIVLVSIKKMIEEGQSVRLNNIFFDYDKFDLKEESFPELDRLLRFLNENKGVKVQIAAHTDDQGSDPYNQRLSENRAKAVLDYLVTKGIDKNRLKSVGFGEKQPIASNENEEGRAQNRRVEFKFIK